VFHKGISENYNGNVFSVHAMGAPRWSGDIAPRIHNIDTLWKR